MRQFLKDYMDFVAKNFWYLLLFNIMVAFFAGVIKGFISAFM